MQRSSSPRSSLRAICFAAAASLALGAARAAPPPPPGGHHPLYFGGDNRAGYPTVITDAGGPTTDGFAAFSITVHPNPFHGRTTLRMALRRGQEARLTIYNLAGRRVREFAQPASLSGWQEITWDGRDAGGNRLSAGVYVYRAEAGGRSVRGKLVLLH